MTNTTRIALPRLGLSLRGLFDRSRTDTESAMALAEFQSPTAAVIAEKLPLGGRATIWVIAASVGAAIAAMALCQVDRVVPVPGKVVSQTPNIVVQPLETSIVRWIAVREGQTVHAGDLLARLDPTVATADATATEAQVASVQAEVDRLTAESRDKPYASDGTPAGDLQASNYAQRHAELGARLETYQQKIDSVRARITRAETDMVAYAEQLRAASARQAIRHELERLRVGNKLNTLDADAQRAEAERSLQAAVAEKSAAWDDLKAAVAEREAAVNQFKRETLQLLTEQGRKLADAREQLNKANLRKQLVTLHADRDAVVLSVAHVSIGSVLQSGDELMTLVPTDGPLEVEATIPGRDAGFVQVGNRAVIKFDTFPYPTYGYADGTVRAVSPDSFTDPQYARRHPTRPNPSAVDSVRDGAFYRASVSIDENRLRNLPSGFHMTPGMPLTLDIEVGQRTVLSYLMSKVIPVLSEGLREP